MEIKKTDPNMMKRLVMASNDLLPEEMKDHSAPPVPAFQATPAHPDRRVSKEPAVNKSLEIRDTIKKFVGLPTPVALPASIAEAYEEDVSLYAPKKSVAPASATPSGSALTPRYMKVRMQIIETFKVIGGGLTEEVGGSHDVSNGRGGELILRHTVKGESLVISASLLEGIVPEISVTVHNSAKKGHRSQTVTRSYEEPEFAVEDLPSLVAVVQSLS